MIIPLHEHFYSGTWPKYAWHSPTEIAMVLFAIISLHLFIRMFDDYMEHISFANWLGLVLAFFLSCWAKPNFILVFALKPGDEVILPSFTFVSTANAFVLRGARLVFVDIRPDTKNIDENLIEDAITDKTKVVVPVHYAGVGCEMDTILDIAKRHGLTVVEDAAQGVMATYKGRALGSMGDYGCFSFHETTWSTP